MTSLLLIESTSGGDISTARSNSTNRCNLKFREFIYRALNSDNSVGRTFKNTLESLLNFFNGFFVKREDGSIITVKCTFGSPERAIAKYFQEQNIILPALTITENAFDLDEEKQKYGALITNEKVWNDKIQRAERVLSIAPRQVTFSYTVNVWAKYMEDLDQLSEQIFFSFNPNLDLETKDSTTTKVYLTDSSLTGELDIEDGRDRILQKAFSLQVETYISYPRFLVTSTGKIEQIKAEIEIT